MQPIRLIAMDMDGTLLTRIDPTTACIPPENARVLRRCVSDGIHLALSSGRMPDDAAFYASDAGLPMHVIGLNGGVITSGLGASPLQDEALPPDIARRVLHIMLERGVDVAVFGPWEVVCMQPRPLSWARIVLGTWYGREGGRLVYRNAGEGVEPLLQHAGKIVALTDQDRDGLAAAKARVQAAFPDLSISSSWWNNFEVNPAGVDKGSALRRLAARLDIPMSQVMAIGDNDNDLPMLRTAGIGVAMGNAPEHVRAAADCITLPNAQHGVAAAIRSLVFGESVPGVQLR